MFTTGSEVQEASWETAGIPSCGYVPVWLAIAGVASAVYVTKGGQLQGCSACDALPHRGACPGGMFCLNASFDTHPEQWRLWPSHPEPATPAAAAPQMQVLHAI